MRVGSAVDLVSVPGGRAPGDASVGSAPRGDLRLVRGEPARDAGAALEETVAAARRIRRQIEEQMARALDELLRMRAPRQGPG